jgi:hypothetical protein
MADGGGAVMTQASVKLIFWGSGWSSAKPSPEIAASTTRIILDSVYTSELGQYHGIRQPRYAGDMIVETPAPPKRFARSDVEALLKNLFESHQLGSPNTATLYVVMTPPNVASVKDLGEHSTYRYLDASWPFVHPVHLAWVTFNGTWAETTATLSHEIVEALSDPNTDGIRLKSTKCGEQLICEIGDVCDSTTNIPSTLGDIVVAAYWSEKVKRCIPGKMQMSTDSLGTLG